MALAHLDVSILSVMDVLARLQNRLSSVLDNSSVGFVQLHVQ